MSFFARMGDGPVPQPRRNAPLPPLEGPRMPPAAMAAGAVRSAERLFGPPDAFGSAYAPTTSPPSSNRSSRLSAGSSLGPIDAQVRAGLSPPDSRSTSASSYQGAGRPAAPVGAGAASPSSAPGTVDDRQADSVVLAMLPVVKRGVASPNKAVFETALDCLGRIERMFGKASLDRHMDALADALEKQLHLPGGDARAMRVLEALLRLCSEDTAEKLHGRFPKHMAELSAPE
mmetsp:Transcript_155506/g.498850  ORF Transcript_155506/g.498850 Transcript_155506/m.498850 type:complete len:231 (+) Transcript_155506:143-835(+)